MHRHKLTNIYSFLDECGRKDDNELLLFRGQDADHSLLPKIARNDPTFDSTGVEQKMLRDLRRVGNAFLPFRDEDEWDLLARAQHFGMATRLLDWTSNPLAALWFAARDLNTEKSGFVYFYVPEPEHLLDEDRQSKGPFHTGRTYIFRPTWNNPRIIAQCGWFTIHRYSKTGGRFVPLDENSSVQSKIDCYEIKGPDKKDVLENLDRLGVNYQAMFPDLEGVCRHLNWRHGYQFPKS